MTALAAVRAACSVGAWPRPLDVLALLRESGNVEAGEARDLVARYAVALAEMQPVLSGEAGVLDALRGFTLER